LFFFFFFSSRRRHTRSYGDWSSDVCSSDLAQHRGVDIRVAVAIAADPASDSEERREPRQLGERKALLQRLLELGIQAGQLREERSEERRVGKECRAGGAADEWEEKGSSEQN